MSSNWNIQYFNNRKLIEISPQKDQRKNAESVSVMIEDFYELAVTNNIPIHFYPSSPNPIDGKRPSHQRMTLKNDGAYQKFIRENLGISSKSQMQQQQPKQSPLPPKNPKAKETTPPPPSKAVESSSSSSATISAPAPLNEVASTKKAMTSKEFDENYEKKIFEKFLKTNKAQAKNITSIRLPSEATAEWLELLYSYSPDITSLAFTFPSTFSDKDYPAILRFSKLTTLDLRGNSGINGFTDNGLTQLSKLPSLVTLTLPHDTKNLAYLNNCSNLSTLILSECKEITVNSFLSLHKGLLRRLDLSHCNQFDDDGIRTILDTCGSITSLRLAHSDITGECFNGVPILNDVDLLFCDKITDEGLKALSSHPLISLKLGSRVITGKGVQILGKCTSLQSLDFYCQNIDHTELSFLPSLVNLTHLDLLQSLQDESLPYLIGCKKLNEMVALSTCNLGNNALETLSKSKIAATIISLELSSGWSMTDEGLKPLLEKCTKLAHFSINYSSDVTVEGLRPLSSIRTLTTVNVNQCDQITDKTVLSFLKNVNTEVTYKDLRKK